MPSFCAVVNCNSKYKHPENISFHKFPFKRTNLLKQWKDFTKRSNNWIPSKWSAICSQHFVDNDFNCLNERKTLKKSAVPSKYLTKDKTEVLQPLREICYVGKLSCVEYRAKQKNSEQIENSCENFLIVPNSFSTKVESKCRLCGMVAGSCVSFANNFEIFGMIQKCFPTLQIHQNDSFPKDMCVVCYESVERFARFIDKVLETQSEFQRICVEPIHQRGTLAAVNSYNDRQLKIKQEPFVLVKQEVSEGFDTLLGDDLDIGMEEVSEQDQSVDEIEQKYQFCDSPMLNAQDVINSCDIMEIINLDDPFINITDDDVGHTQNNASSPGLQVSQHHLPSISTNESFHADLLIKEHNYANSLTEQKNQWKLKNLYKTEKIEVADMQEDVVKKQQQTDGFSDQINVSASSCQDLSISRSTKPIVTNVSEIPNSLLRDLVPGKNHTSLHPAQTGTLIKPNIEVLNDSIVKSSDAFRLHTCHICVSKFFSNDSLIQHYKLSHALMVCVSTKGLKIENIENQCNIQDALLMSPSQTSTVNEFTQTKVSNYWHTDWEQDSVELFAQNSQLLTAPVTSLNKTVQEASSSFDILGLQQSFLRETEDFTAALNQNVCQLPLTTEVSSQTVVNFQTQPLTTIANDLGIQNYSIVTTNYSRLHKRFRTLKQKFHRQKSRCKLKHCCQRCNQNFSSIYDLLRHKRTEMHFVVKPKHFVTKCCGCMQFFRTRFALQQHMRYICQLLPLRWYRAKLMNFKCQYCLAITFTRWRLYRRHVNKCRHIFKKYRKSYDRLQLTTFQKFAKRKETSIYRSKSTSFRNIKSVACIDCGKVFSGTNGLNQHRITHSSERRHKCSICQRAFKRLNGLSQHLRGFHLKIKPYACAICKHSYALKCDMLRCRHSQLRDVD